MQSKGEGGIRKLRRFLDDLPEGTAFTAQQAKDVAGIQEFARRLRELRAHEGYRIESYRDANRGLDTYVYRGKGAPEQPKEKRKAISAAQKERLKEQRWCELCGRAAGDPHPVQPNRKVNLMVRSRYDDAVLCSYCTEGLSDIQSISAFHEVEILKAQIKRLRLRERAALREYLTRWAVDDLADGGTHQIRLFDD